VTSRRRFIALIPAVAAGVALERVAHAQAKPPANAVPENDPQAAALGYKMDASKVDKAKFPKFAAGQHCGNCQLFQGKPTDPWGPCSIFANRQVAGPGWCSAWVKKA
jgi:hypothetical protein